MTKKQIKILRYIHKQPRVWRDVCNKFDIPCDTNDKLYLDAFEHGFFEYAELISKTPHFDSIIRISNKGTELLEEKSDRTRSRMILFASNCISAAFGSIITLLVQWFVI